MDPAHLARRLRAASATAPAALLSGADRRQTADSGEGQWDGRELVDLLVQNLPTILAALDHEAFADRWRAELDRWLNDPAARAVHTAQLVAYGIDVAHTGPASRAFVAERNAAFPREVEPDPDGLIQGPTFENTDYLRTLEALEREED